MAFASEKDAKGITNYGKDLNKIPEAKRSIR